MLVPSHPPTIAHPPLPVQSRNPRSPCQGRLPRSTRLRSTDRHLQVVRRPPGPPHCPSRARPHRTPPPDRVSTPPIPTSHRTHPRTPRLRRPPRSRPLLSHHRRHPSRLSRRPTRQPPSRPRRPRCSHKTPRHLVVSLDRASHQLPPHRAPTRSFHSRRRECGRRDQRVGCGCFAGDGRGRSGVGRDDSAACGCRRCRRALHRQHEGQVWGWRRSGDRRVVGLGGKRGSGTGHTG